MSGRCDATSHTPCRASVGKRKSWHCVPPLAAAVLSLAPVATASALAADESPSGSRPRIGLVLGGGGAKGAAHIGVLKVLEELRVPVDCVVGTSMGALVGASFAAGVTPDELEQVVTGIDWTATFGSATLRDASPIHRKVSGITYSNSLDLGLKDGGVVAAGGLLRTQDVEELLRQLVDRARLESDFDRLPLPFRAVATDMRSGRMVVLASGDLSVAMRASMAVPGVFAPVVSEGYVLSDGGMMRNLPIDIARELCGDVIIASSLDSPPPQAEDLVTALQLIGRSVDVMIEANVAAQLETVTDRDVVIHVPMGDIGSGDFARVAEAIPLGTEAANSQADQLRRYSMPEAEYLAWRQSVTSPARSTVTFADIQIEGTDRVNPDYVLAQVRSRPGVETTEQRVADDTSHVFALGDFEAVEYRLIGDPDTPTLEIGVKEKSWGPDFLSFDLGLGASAGGDTAFVLRGEHLRTWINPAGGQWRNTVQIGRTALLQSTVYQPVDARHRFFVEPGIRATRSLEDVYADGDRIARYDLREGHVGFDGGLALGTLAELRLGLRYGLADASVDTGAADLPEVDSATEAGWVARFVYDSRDAPVVPTRGTIGRLRYLRSHESLGSDFSYESLEAAVMRAIPFRGDVLYVGAAGGTDFSSDLPPYRFFRMGGYRSFPGLEAGELRGGEYWTGSALYLWKLADIQSLFGQALFGGLRLQAGEMKDRIDGIDDGTIYGASVFVGGRTPLGPVVVTLGGTTNDSFNLYFSLGRPIEEGSIWDDIQ